MTIAADEVVATRTDDLKIGPDSAKALLYLPVVFRGDCIDVREKEDVPGIGEFIEHSDIGILQIILAYFVLPAYGRVCEMLSERPECPLSSCRLYDLTFHDVSTAATDDFARETVAIEVRIFLRLTL